MIEFDQVCKRYEGGYEALTNLSFHIPRGEMRFLTGHSGAGKSTLLKLIMVMERASSGQVIVGGRNLSIRPALVPVHGREESAHGWKNSVHGRNCAGQGSSGRNGFRP